MSAYSLLLSFGSCAGENSHCPPLAVLQLPTLPIPAHILAINGHRQFRYRHVPKVGERYRAVTGESTAAPTA